MAGPSMTQGLPSATYAMLNELNQAHARVFPIANHAGTTDHRNENMTTTDLNATTKNKSFKHASELVVRPDTGDGSESIEEINELSTKSGMLRVIFGGWIDGLLSEQDHSGAHVVGNNQSRKMILGLSEAIPGPLLYFKHKPRALVFRLRNRSSATSGIRGAATAKPSTSTSMAPNGMESPTEANLSAALSSSDDDLATFLIPRAIKASACLQAALLSYKAPSDEQQISNSGAESFSTNRDRIILRDQLDELSTTIVEILAESGIRIPCGTSTSGTVGGGLGKAREIVQNLLEASQTLISTPSSAGYPRQFRVSGSSRLPIDAFDADESAIDVKSPLHARALLTTTLRLLLRMTATSPFLYDLRPRVVDMIAESWPQHSRSKHHQNHAITANHKGKQRAEDDADINVLAESLALVFEILENPLAAFSDQSSEVMGRLAMHELNLRLIEEEGTQSASEETESASSVIVDRLMAKITAKLFATVEQSYSSQQQDAGSRIRQMLDQSLGQALDRLTRCLPDASTSPEIRLACLFSLSSMTLTSTSTSKSDSLASDADTTSTAACWAAVDDRTLEGLRIYLQRQHIHPFELLHDLTTLQAATTSAWKHLQASLDVVPSAPLFDLSRRKRTREEEIAPSSDGVDFDLSTQGLGRRSHKMWKEPVAFILRNRLDPDANVSERDGPGKVIEQLAASIGSLDTERTVSNLKTIGLLACARSGSVVDFDRISSNGPEIAEAVCRICDAWAGDRPVQGPAGQGSTGEQENSAAHADARLFDSAPLNNVRHLISRLASSTETGTMDSKVRLAILTTLSRILRHTRTNACGCSLAAASHPRGAPSVRDDPLVAFVLEHLEASQRGLRLAAGHVLVAIVQVHQLNDPQATFVNDLFTILGRLLSHISPSIVETTLLILGQIARNAVPQGVLECEALAGLVTRLGHSNTFIKSVAKTQLEAVASYRDIKIYALVQPHFATIAPLLVGPGSAATLAAALECFHQPREALLRLTREYTLPQVVLEENVRSIEDIARASNLSVPVMLTQGAPAAAVLAKLYMLHDDAKQRRGLQFYMAQIKSNVQAQSHGPVSITLPKILESLKVPLVYRLALELGDEDPRISAQAERALKAAERASEAISSKTKIELGEVLKASIVGILSHMNRGLNEPTTHRPLRDKQRIIRSLAAVTSRVGPAIAGFSPQIMATLQSALETKGLREVTLKAFNSFINSLKFNEIGPFIGPCTANFVRIWHEFSKSEKAAATETIEYIVLQNSDNLESFVHDVADLSGIPELVKCQDRLLSKRRDWSFARRSEFLLTRVSSENDVVALQALKELKELMTRPIAQLRALSSGDTFDHSVGPLVKTLFGASAKDGPEFEQIRNVAFECLGILGALDPDRFEFPPGDEPVIVLENFNDKEESIDFALHLIQDLLIGAYRSTNDTKHQEFLAYAIQELLSYCGFTSELVLGSVGSAISHKVKASTDQSVKDRWNRLPKSVLETCGPLLGGRFSFKEKSSPRGAEYPIYNSTTSYRDWIRILANDLILKLEGEAKKIFGAFPPVLHLEDIAVAQHLLPHLVLNSLISGTDDDRVRICVEMQTVLSDQISREQPVSDNSRRLSAQTVFDLMDHISRWITLARKRSLDLKSRRRSSTAVSKSKTTTVAEKAFELALINVESVLGGIPRIVVGQAALTCKSYARALLTFESHIVAQNSQKDAPDDSRLQDYYENLHECYAALDEPDGMEGISTKIVSSSVLHQIREHESTGRWTSAQSCWEVKLQQEPNDAANHAGLLRCLRNLGHYDSMRTHILGLANSRNEDVDWDRVLAPYNIEASLFVGDWDSVEEALKIPDLEGPEAAFGRVICAMKDAMGRNEPAEDDRMIVDSGPSSSILPSRIGFSPRLERAFHEARMELGAPIVAAGRESYRRVYDAVVQLHILNELESIHIARRPPTVELPSDLIAKLASRIEATSPSFRAREPILNMRRTAFRLSPPSQVHPTGRTIAAIGDLWLETSKIARKAGHSQTAYSAILQARELNARYTFLQSAKLLKASDQSYRAIQEIDNGLQAIIMTSVSTKAGTIPAELIKKGSPSPLAKASLRRARWMHEAGRLEDQEILSMYHESETLAPDWESPCYHLAHYLDQAAETSANVHANSRKRPDPVTELCQILVFRVQAVEMFIQALRRGTKYIYQSMPRMLTIWLEIGEAKPVLEVMAKRREDPRAELSGSLYELYNGFTDLDKAVCKAISKLASYQWLTVLPQLVSRILHPNKKVTETLEKILVHVLKTYPHHGFWAMASGAKSTHQQRSRRNLRVLEKAKAYAANDAQSKVPGLINVGLKLVDELLGLCNYSLDKTSTPRLHKDFPRLHALAPFDLIIPLQSSLNVTLPSQSQTSATFQPFRDHLPSFKDFDDVITIMSSLQKPRKITVIGSDGNSYSFLCKPKDDLRKDARLMEFNSMIIKLLKKDSEARGRRLGIRTYAVVPLNEDCGLIEWVPHVVVLRGILNKAYQARGIAPWNPELKKVFDTIRSDPKEIANRFQNEVQKKFPPVFHQWFLETFPEPSAWLQARMAYSRTAAVISMVGFVLGLGDRHCENILLDGTTGDTVHVDFNCLFDRGRTFDVPEQVPFRLTANIVDGMGVTGVEGVYRRAAEITLRILRENKDSLMTVLETFLHDPLVEWQPTKSRSDKKDVSRRDDPSSIIKKAKTSLDPISNKLRGLQVTADPASVGAKEVTIGEQVERLIREARNPKNLGSMYVGWCSWF